MTPDQTQDQIVAEFSKCTDWFAKYEHLIALGNAHPRMDARFKRDEHAVAGCQSQVWLHCEHRDGRLRVWADSDSKIIRGVLALLLRVLNDRPPAEISQVELHFLERTGLATNLSPSRANGVANIVQHIRQQAADHAPETRRDSAPRPSQAAPGRPPAR